MRCPGLDDLPPPPSGRQGWPWTEETPPGKASASAAAQGRITIVTACRNAAAFIEETIRSVLLQGHPDIEYIVIDGGSDDGTVDVIRRYQPWLAHVASEPDRGYADALNKGFARATGGIRAWLHASDLYLPFTLERVAGHLAGGGARMIYGNDWMIDEAGRPLRRAVYRVPDLRAAMLFGRWTPLQDACFWTADAHAAAGSLDDGLRYAADFDWFLRMSLRVACRHVDDTLSCFRQHGSQLSSTSGAYRAERNTAWRRVALAERLGPARAAAGFALQVPLTRLRIGGLRGLVNLPSRESMALLWKTFARG